MTEEDVGLEPSEYLTAQLQQSVSWWATPGSDGQVGVVLEGTIHNSGTDDVVAIVNIKVFDGRDWRSYNENAGVVSAGGDVDFYWDQGLGPIDENAVEIEYVVSRGWTNKTDEPRPAPQGDSGDKKKKWSWEWHWQKGSG